MRSYEVGPVAPVPEGAGEPGIVPVVPGVAGGLSPTDDRGGVEEHAATMTASSSVPGRRLRLTPRGSVGGSDERINRATDEVRRGSLQAPARRSALLPRIVAERGSHKQAGHAPNRVVHEKPGRTIAASAEA